MANLFKKQGKGTGGNGGNYWKNKGKNKGNSFGGDTRELVFELCGEDTLALSF